MAGSFAQGFTDALALGWPAAIITGGIGLVILLTIIAMMVIG